MSLYAITLFGHTFPKPKHRREPTPLEVAVHQYIETQHALLEARNVEERASATVSMFEGRLVRLSRTIDELRTDSVQDLR